MCRRAKYPNKHVVYPPFFLCCYSINMSDKEAQEDTQVAEGEEEADVEELQAITIERKREVSDKQKRHMEHMRVRRAEVQQQKKVEQLVQEKIESNSIKHEPTESLFGTLEYATIAIAFVGAAAFYYQRQQPKSQAKPVPILAKPTADSYFN